MNFFNISPRSNQTICNRKHSRLVNRKIKQRQQRFQSSTFLKKLKHIYAHVKYVLVILISLVQISLVIPMLVNQDMDTMKETVRLLKPVMVERSGSLNKSGEPSIGKVLFDISRS
ncbi:MAG: hypothetical protein AAF927_02380 [Bacteroidota bacterium]